MFSVFVMLEARKISGGVGGSKEGWDDPPRSLQMFCLVNKIQIITIGPLEQTILGTYGF